MGAFGDRLRRERELRGVTLDEIATATKIGTRSLKALENEDFSKLPGGIFNKGFVRAYAKFLGINEDQAVADYVSAAGEAEQNSDAVIERLAAESERRAEEKRIERQREKSAGLPFTWNGIAIVVVLVVAALLGWQYYTKHREAKAQQSAAVQPPVAKQSTRTEPVEAPVAAANTSAGVSTPAATTPSTGDKSAKAAPGPGPANTQSAESTKTARLTTLASSAQVPVPHASVNNQPIMKPISPTSTVADSSMSPVAPAGPEFVVVVKTTKPSWVSSLVDNKSKTGKLMPPNAEATFHARSNLRLTIGNAGGVEISFNGKTLPVVGEENKTRTLIFTPEGPQQ